MMLVCFPRFGKLILLNWSLKPAVTRPPLNERNDICLFLLGEFTFALWYLLMYWPTMLEVRVLKLESLTSISSGFCYTCLMPFDCTAKMPVCQNHGCQSLWLFWQHFLSRAHAHRAEHDILLERQAQPLMPDFFLRVFFCTDMFKDTLAL